MLSAWFRVKYPHVVCGALAASAPVRQYQGVVDPLKYNQIITNDFAKSNPVSVTQIRSSWNIISNFSSSNPLQLADTLGLCSVSNVNDIYAFIYAFISNAYSYMAMADYPYPTTFLGPMPGYPIYQ